MPLSIIIVNYRCAALILDCIESALQYSSGPNFQWIIVDNNSNDNSKEIITAKYPFIKWIDMGYNAGFARANNEGIRQSKEETVLLLNPDTIILDDAIEKCLLRFLPSSYIACSVQLLNTDKSPQITGNFFMKGGLNHLLPLPYLGALLRKMAFVIKVKKTNIAAASTEEKVDWINGAFMMVKKNAIESAGMFDEDFFLYSEEIEWCSRLNKVGNICVYGDLHTIHIQGEAINSSTQSTDKGYQNIFDKKGLQLMVSNHLRIRKQFGIAWFLFHLFMHTVDVPLFFFCSIIDNILHFRNPFAQVKNIAGFTRNVLRLWSLVLKIISGKPYFYKML
ncbi:glycosyltransferase family 2 protein [Panacibacter ginsenosidivorans]|uniref:Glycosyltransferase family 2 protein n=1 Tax=Panacibacter ginsenosidivorans TaxID=1813871 RepID=A0A5B8V5F5_9BACT|nr:glycosyltransferase family 2 protein [Panacibacter ginsenosidivorans]QEC65951.1 glycosyltransferase family 2 protein [Panacibacter ginsenosidivorans]